jgi:ankyrin repeat protein
MYKPKPEILKLLLVNKAPVNETNDDGWSPLHYADSAEAIQILLEHKATVDIKNDEGNTHLFLGSKRNQELLLWFRNCCHDG